MSEDIGWYVEVDSDSEGDAQFLRVRDQRTHEVVAGISPDFLTEDEREICSERVGRLARLIAAAPELLEALSNLLHASSQSAQGVWTIGPFKAGGPVERAFAAIAKAEGGGK